jgi:hypothetical protein
MLKFGLLIPLQWAANSISETSIFLEEMWDSRAANACDHDRAFNRLTWFFH